jgi:hypothetical protein
VPWTFQVVDVVFVSHASTYSLNFECGYLDCILPGSHIISDGWAVYAHIDQIQGAVYTRETVIHDVNFVNPDNQDIHTQNLGVARVLLVITIIKHLPVARSMPPNTQCPSLNWPLWYL